MIQHFTPDFASLEDVKVSRLEKQEIMDAFSSLDERLVHAKDGKEAIAIVKEYFALSDDLSSAISLIYIRHQVDTQDEYYKELSDLIDEIMPEISAVTNQFDKDFYESPFRKELVEEFGQLYFDQVALSMKTFSEEIINPYFFADKKFKVHKD